MSKSRGEFLAQTYARYVDELVRYLHGANRGDRADAQDIAQAAFAKLAALPKPQDVENPRAFLYRAAKNIAIDEARRHRTRERYDLELAFDPASESTDPRSPERIALSREQLALLENAIRRLPPKRRRVFLLNRIHNLTYSEIASETGLSVAGVRKHIQRAMAECERSLAVSSFGGRLNQLFGRNTS